MDIDRPEVSVFRIIGVRTIDALPYSISRLYAKRAHCSRLSRLTRQSDTHDQRNCHVVSHSSLLSRIKIDQISSDQIRIFHKKFLFHFVFLFFFLFRCKMLALFSLFRKIYRETTIVTLVGNVR